MNEQIVLDYSSLFGGNTPQRNSLAIEKAIFDNAWQLLKQYRHLKQHGDDAGWEQVLEKANRIYSMGAGSAADELGKALSIAVVNYLDAASAENEKQQTQ